MHAPLPYERNASKKPGMADGSVALPGFTMRAMLSMPAVQQNVGRTSDFVTIIDETGIDSGPRRDSPYAQVIVCSEGIYWRGEGALEIARKWLGDEFGVTLTEEKRETPVRFVERRGAPED